MADYLPYHGQGTPITVVASAAVTGGQLIEVTVDGTCAPASAGSEAVIGHAAHDAATGVHFVVHTPGTVVQVGTSSAAIEAGARVKAGAAGKVAEFVSGTDDATLSLGVVLVGASAADSPVRYLAI